MLYCRSSKAESPTGVARALLYCTSTYIGRAAPSFLLYQSFNHYDHILFIICYWPQISHPDYYPFFTDRLAARSDAGLNRLIRPAPSPRGAIQIYIFGTTCPPPLDKTFTVGLEKMRARRGGRGSGRFKRKEKEKSPPCRNVVGSWNRGNCRDIAQGIERWIVAGV